MKIFFICDGSEGREIVLLSSPINHLYSLFGRKAFKKQNGPGKFPQAACITT